MSESLFYVIAVQDISGGYTIGHEQDQNGSYKPLTFDTLEDAQQENSELISDYCEQIILGDRAVGDLWSGKVYKAKFILNDIVLLENDKPTYRESWIIMTGLDIDNI